MSTAKTKENPNPPLADAIGSASFDGDEGVAELFRLRPLQMQDMAQRAIAAIKHMYDVLYALDWEAEEVFKDCMVTARFRKPMLSPYSDCADADAPKVSISTHQTEKGSALERAARRSQQKKKRRTRRENKIELQIYELKSKLS